MIEIVFDNQTAEYRPGEMISGKVIWSNLPDKKREIETLLIWYTDSIQFDALDPRASFFREQKTIAHQQTVAVSASGFRDFKFPAPIGPFSFSGELFSLFWAIEVEIGRKIYSGPLTISPTGKKIVLNQSYKDGKIQPLKKEPLV